jgi:hypothetical protein
VHGSLTEHARCLFGDEYREVPECALEHRTHYFVEELTFAAPDDILAMLRTLCPHGVDGRLPVWVRNLAYRLVLLQRPDEPALLREAAGSLWMHGPDWDEIANGMRRRAAFLEAEPRTREGEAADAG